MSGDQGVTRWLRDLKAGDQDAARLLWQRYYRELVELARARLGRTPRRIADEEDVALSVLRCLCEGAARGQFAAVVNRQELWQLLPTITGGRDGKVLSAAAAGRMLTRHDGAMGLGVVLGGAGRAERFSHGGRNAGYDALPVRVTFGRVVSGRPTVLEIGSAASRQRVADRDEYPYAEPLDRVLGRYARWECFSR